MMFVLAGLVKLFFWFTIEEVGRYEPASGLAAKRVNEQIKLMANGMNTVAIAFVSVLALKGLVQADQPDYTVMVIYIAVGAIFHKSARDLAGAVKDEAVRNFGDAAALNSKAPL